VKREITDAYTTVDSLFSRRKNRAMKHCLCMSHYKTQM